MAVASLLRWLEQTSVATGIRDGLYLFPLLEAAHVVGLALVVGTIAVIDLRLLGLASTHRAFNRIASDTLKWTLGAFVLTAVTGLLMFSTNATLYFHNPYFRAKIALLVLAALNAAVFEATTRRTIARWDTSPSAPRLGRAVATVSLVIWVAVIVAGRMIGFTVTRATSPDTAPVEVNFEDLLGLPDDTGTAPPPATPDGK